MTQRHSDYKVFEDVSYPRKLFVDDVREAPDHSWDIARSFHEAIMDLETGRYSEVSLDHDLGCFYGNKEMTGRDILNWLIQRKLDGEAVPSVVKVHSANPVGIKTMEEDIQRYWEEDLALEEISSTNGC